MLLELHNYSQTLRTPKYILNTFKNSNLLVNIIFNMLILRPVVRVEPQPLSHVWRLNVV